MSSLRKAEVNQLILVINNGSRYSGKVRIGDNQILEYEIIIPHGLNSLSKFKPKDTDEIQRKIQIVVKRGTHFYTLSEHEYCIFLLILGENISKVWKARAHNGFRKNYVFISTFEPWMIETLTKNRSLKIAFM